MPNVPITQLPAAQPLDGSEIVPIVQQGVTVRTTTQAIAASPNMTQSFLTAVQEPTLPNSRYVQGNNGVTTSDGGPLNPLTVELTGAALQFFNAPAGLIAKPTATTVAVRTLLAGGSGLSILNGNGVTGDPIIALAGRNAALEALSGSSGLVALAGTGLTSVDILGTANQISVANGSGPSNPTIAIASNPVLPGVEGFVPPSGTTAERPALPGPGTIRYNTDISNLEVYDVGTGWGSLATGAVTLINTGTGLTGGPITSSGTISIANTGIGAGTYGLADHVPQLIINAQGQATNGFNVPIAIAASQIVSGTLDVARGGTGAGSLTGYLIGNGTSAFTASATIPTTDLSGSITNTQLQYDSITINGGNVALGGSITVTATAANPLTIGTGLSGGSYDGSAPITIAIDSTVATLSGLQTLTNKTINGNDNTLSNIGNSSLTNSSVTIGTTAISLGSSSLTLGGLTSVTVTQNPVNNLDLATKQYVDNIAVQGTYYHAPVKYETASPLTATYNQPGGPGVGVGATLTNAGTLAAFAPDGPTAAPGDRILIYQQTNQFENGVYTVTTVGDGSTPWVLTRSTDTDTYGLINPNSLGQGDAFFVQAGNTGAGETYVCNTVGTITFGTTNITFVQVSDIQVYTAGTGLTLSGTQFSITNTGVSAATYGSGSTVPTIAVNAQGQITSASNTSISINGNQITSGTVGSSYISGSYTGITGVGTLTAGTWNANTIGVGYGGTGLASYTSGDLLYATGSTTLSKLALGSSTYLLTSSGSAPQWSDPAGVTVGSATSATTSTNLAGGAANRIAYQTGSGTTSFITAPTIASTYLQWNGSAFTWAATTTGTVTSVDVSGGTTGLTTSGGPITSSGTITLAGTLAATNGGTGQTSYTTGDLLYASGSTALSKLSIGSSTYLLTSSGSAPQWSAPSGVTVGNATNAVTSTNIAGGSAGALAYNTGSGATSFLALGTTNYVLTAGASAPQYVAQSTLSVGSATNATNTTNVAISTSTANSDYYLTVVSTTTGNLPEYVATGLTANPSTGKITGGIAGGTF